MSKTEYPRRWPVHPLGEVVRLRVGLATSQKRAARYNPIPFLRPANVTTRGLELSDLQLIDISDDEMLDLRLETGDVVLAEASGSPELVGRSAIWRGEIEKCSFANSIVRFRSAALSPEFLRVVLEDHRLQGRLIASAKGVGIQHLPVSKIVVLPTPIPPPREQAQIARSLRERLADLDAAKDRLLSARQGTAEQITLTLHAAVAPDPKGDATGWQFAKLGELGELKIGTPRDSKRPYTDPTVAYVGVSHVQEGDLDLSELPSMRILQKRLPDVLLDDNDLLITSGGSSERLGRPAMVPKQRPETLTFQNHLIRFRCGPLLDPRFALLIFRSLYRAGRFADAARGSTELAHLTVRDVAEIETRIPSLESQANIVESVSRQMIAINEQIDHIDSGLNGLGGTERELYALATAGGLVEPSDEGPSAESAIAAEAKVREELAEASAVGRITRKIVRPELALGLPDRLLEELKRNPNGVSIPDLIIRAGLNRNSVAHIESIFAALRDIAAPDTLIVEGGENALIRVASDATL